MKPFVRSILILIFLEIIISQCANPLRPTGGPKDTIPPNLLLMQPLDQTTEFEGREIRLFFDEYINADKLRQKLIITPNTNIKYKHIVKKRDLIIKLDNDLADSTTYTFNFFDGVTDITEKNPAENLILAISTGSYIDSLQLFGTVKDLFTNKRMEKILVGIYKVSDSLDLLADSPYYFYSTNKEGYFSINNIKSDRYILVAFKDDNNNLKLDAATESYGFSSDTIDALLQVDSIHVRIITADASALRLISSRPSGKYFDVRYSKPINNYQVDQSTYHHTLYHGFNEDKTAIRFYQPLSMTFSDSIQVAITANDTIESTTIDTLFVKFRESTRKYTTLKYSILSPNSIDSDHKIIVTIAGNKPLIANEDDFFTFTFDSLFSFPLKIDTIISTINGSSLSYHTALTHRKYTNILDSLIDSRKGDTLNADSTQIGILNQLQLLPKDKILIRIREGSVYSADYDTIKEEVLIHQFRKRDDLGIIRVNVSTLYESYEIALINKSGGIAKKIRNCSTCVFTNIVPGTYTVKAYIDNNMDGTWKIGNINNMVEPEQIIHFREDSELRANWNIELDFMF